ncbi:MAG TPA: DUF4199 domain-containing protein [Bacteroidia bacterium]|nr:DUF4199 domain-containing protein [Bacteroidia bacterium]
MKSVEWKWGLLIGGAGVAWLVLAWALGLHSRTFGWVWGAALVSFAISLVGYVLAMRDLKRHEPEATFAEGVRSAALIAAVSAVVAIGGRVLYLTVLNPGWTDFVVGEMRRHYEKQGVGGEQLEQIAAGVAQTYGFVPDLIQAGVGAFLTGVLFSALILGVMRRHSYR